MLQNRPEKTTLLRLSALVLGFAAVSIASQAQAQTRSYNTPYIMLRGGTTVYGGELDQAGSASGRDATSWLTRNFGFFGGGELGYQFTPAFGFGIGANYAQYNALSEVGFPIGVGCNTFNPVPTCNASENLLSFTGAFRYTALPNSPISPFVNFGGMLVVPGNSVNGGNPLTTRPVGGGPLFGAGLDLAFSPKLSLFANADFGFIFPDNTVDNLDPGGVTGGGGDDVEFDVLGHYGGGLRYNFRGVGVKADIESIQCPAELTAGETGSFMVMTNADATQPVTAAWDFGDGSNGSGMSTTHAFSAPGTYTVSTEVTNSLGDDSESCLVTVNERQIAAAISGCRATPASVDANGTVTLNGTVVGTEPVTISVDFGDGSATASSLPARHVYATTGSYTARITVSNAAGTNSCTIPVNVGDSFCNTISELNPVYYGFGASTLTADARTRLDENIEILRRCPSICVTINGYADDQETDVDRLSQRRADAARDYYIAQGIDAGRVRAVGRGQDPNANSKEDPGPGDSRARRADSIPSSCTGF